MFVQHHERLPHGDWRAVGESRVRRILKQNALHGPGRQRPVVHVGGVRRQRAKAVRGAR